MTTGVLDYNGDGGTILYLATGAPAISPIAMGPAAVPQVAAQARTEGSFDYMRALTITGRVLTRRG